MDPKTRDFPDDPTAAQRRKKPGARDLEALKLAGGVEGGMAAGSAGGPGEKAKAAHGRRFD